MTISGADSGNYTLTQPTYLTADITPATLTITATTNTKTHDVDDIGDGDSDGNGFADGRHGNGFDGNV